MLSTALDRDVHVIRSCYLYDSATGLNNGKQIDAIALDFTKLKLLTKFLTDAYTKGYIIME